VVAKKIRHSNLLVIFVKNRNNIVIENSVKSINNNSNKTYTEVVSSKNRPIMSVSCQVTFEDEIQRNKEKENIMINQRE
jgi:hypothetical protein